MVEKDNELTDIVENLVIANSDLDHQNVNLYFDTADVRSALLGAYDCQKGQGGDYPQIIEKEHFHRPQTLVACLLSSNFLGRFSLLPPHQSELLRQLEQDTAFSRGHQHVGDRVFLEQIGFTDPLRLNIKADSSEREIHQFIQRYVGNKIEAFFCAIQCLRHHWWERLRHLRRESILVSYEGDYSFIDIQQDSALINLIEERQKLRPSNDNSGKWSINNFNDAFSILLLADLVERHNAHPEKHPIPRFYDPNQVFADVAKAAGIEERLIIESNGSRSSVFVSSKYMVYRASLRAKSPEDRAAFFRDFPTPEEVARIASSLKEESTAMRDKLTEWLRLTFLRDIWAKTVAMDDVRSIIGRWEKESKTAGDIYASVSNERFKRTISQSINEARMDVLHRARDYREYNQLWVELGNDVAAWRRRLRGTDSPDAGSMDMMLLRIRPPVQVLDDLHDHLHAIESDDPHETPGITGAEAFSKVFISLYNFMKRDNKKLFPDKVEYLAGALWTMNPKSTLLKRAKFRDYADSGRSFFVSAVCVDAALSRGDDLDWAIETARLLTASDDYPRKSKIPRITVNSSIAYLWFHVWRNKWRDGAWWRLNHSQISSPYRKSTDTYIEQAIKSVDLAWQEASRFDLEQIESLDQDLRERIIYIINQRLYYLVEQGLWEREPDMREAWSKMKTFHDGGNLLWKAAYEDTIARYFAFCAENSRSEDSWSQFIARADRHFKKTNGLSGSKAVEQFGDYLAFAISDGFERNAYSTGRDPGATSEPGTDINAPAS